MAVKTRELRKDSIRSYNSMSGNLIGFLKKKEMAVFEFSRQHALDYMNYLYLDSKIGEVSFNNYLTFCRTLFNWLVENQYCKANPFLQIKKKKEKPKLRIPITAEFRNKIKKHHEANGEYEYLAICMLTYYTFLRP